MIIVGRESISDGVDGRGEGTAVGGQIDGADGGIEMESSDVGCFKMEGEAFEDWFGGGIFSCGSRIRCWMSISKVG